MIVSCSLTNSKMNSMVEDTEEEKLFRDRYANELKKKKQHGKVDELDEERRKVKQQGMKTPGRRGEQIKHEEIGKEISRRYTLGKEKKTNEKMTPSFIAIYLRCHSKLFYHDDIRVGSLLALFML
jgi:hypothetical protein